MGKPVCFSYPASPAPPACRSALAARIRRNSSSRSRYFAAFFPRQTAPESPDRALFQFVAGGDVYLFDLNGNRLRDAIDDAFMSSQRWQPGRE
jgi:hypothetical protein